MKLTELLEQCESDNTAASLLAKCRLRYHSADALPELATAAREFLDMLETTGGTSAKRISRLEYALAVAEEVKDHSDQLTPTPKPKTVTMP